MPQLSIHQRQTLEHLHGQQATKAAMARELGVHPATIKRELERNKINGNYEALHAHEKAKRRKQKAGTENRKKRTSRYLSMKSLVQWQVNFRIGMNERDPDAPATGLLYNKRREKRFRIYSCLAEARRPKRIRKESFRKWRYLEWKKWYDRRVRKRNHVLENLRRTPRSAYELSLLRSPFPFKKQDIDDRRLIRFADRALARMEKEKPLDRLKKIVRCSCPISFPHFSSPSHSMLILELEENTVSFHLQQLKIYSPAHFF